MRSFLPLASEVQIVVVSGINLITLLWTDGIRRVPINYRIFDKAHNIWRSMRSDCPDFNSFKTRLNISRAPGTRRRTFPTASWKKI